MCGEKADITGHNIVCRGSPPRVRGKGIQQRNCWVTMRITPACAGKRRALPRSQPALGDHPRVCGEKADITGHNIVCRGSPPRVRGKGIQQRNCWVTMRITPACAGKRRALPRSQPALGDHPRVCGEKVTTASPEGGRRGSPPRVRGKVSCHCWITPQLGITPACAGKRLCYPFFLSPLWDHPRVCGEKHRPSKTQSRPAGSPPRVRGKVISSASEMRKPGITPACAGKSSRLLRSPVNHKDHPRVCGEKRNGAISI